MKRVNCSKKFGAGLKFFAVAVAIIHLFYSSLGAVNWREITAASNSKLTTPSIQETYGTAFQPGRLLQPEQLSDFGLSPVSNWTKFKSILKHPTSITILTIVSFDWLSKIVVSIWMWPPVQESISYINFHTIKDNLAAPYIFLGKLLSNSNQVAFEGFNLYYVTGV